MPYYDTPPRVTDLLAKVAEEQRRAAANRRLENGQISRGGITIVDEYGEPVGRIGEYGDGRVGVAQRRPDGTYVTALDAEVEAAAAAQAAAAAADAAADVADAMVLLDGDMQAVEQVLSEKADQTYVDTVNQAVTDAQADASQAISDAEAANAAATSAAQAASTAQSTADDAEQAALEAAGIASSKGKVYYGTTAPAADVNGLWIDQTDGRNIPKRWNGATWMAVQDADIADAAQAAANANTAASNAQSAADAAASAAAVADGKAVDAASDAATAIANAATADGKAADAQTAADAAQAAADLAQQAADGAATLAGQAKTTGENAASAAQAALDDLVTVNAGLDAVELELPGKAGIDYVQSRGTDLVANGTGFLGNNYNFSAFTYDGTDAAPGARGSFVTSAASASRFSDELIPVDMGKRYILSAWARQQTPDVTARFYIGLAPYDAQGVSLSPQHYAYRPGSMTTLAADLKPGDTTVTLTDATGWAATGDSTGQKYIGFWDYTDSNGRLWEPGTYTRNFFSWSERTGNVLTIAAGAYSGTLIPAGTKVSNNVAGGSYMYTTASNQVAQQEWTQYTSADISGHHGHIGGIHDGSTGSAATTAFPPGTAAVKILFLTNRDATGGTSRMAFAGLSMSDAAAALASAEIAASDAATADGKAVTAQSRADAAHSLATTAKSTADTAVSNAATAQQAADDAEQAALNAAGIANAKGKVYYTPSAPAGDANGLWIDPTGGANAPKRWNGSAWVEVTDKVAKDAASAAAAAQSAANTADGKAVAAQADATTAIANAATADGKAVTAQQAADAAQSTANAANTLAGQAKTIGEAAGDAAETAGLTADQAKAVADLAVPRTDGLITHSPFSWRKSVSSLPDPIVIKTPISFSAEMVRIKITGRQLAATGTIDLDIQFYAYAINGGTINSPSYTSSGEESVVVRLAKTLSDNKAVIILSTADGLPWAYPSLSVDYVQNGYTSHDMTAGWSAESTSDFSDLTTPVAATSRDIGDTHKLTQGWRTTGTTTIDGGKITADSVKAAQIAANAITANEILAGAVVAGKIATDAVTSTTILAGAVSTAKLDAEAVTAAKLAANSVVAGKVAADAIVAGNLAADAVVAGNVAANAVTTSTIAADAVKAGKIDALAVNTRELATNAVTAAKITAGAVITEKLDALAVTAAKLAANSVVAGKVAANAIVAGNIAANGVVAGNLAANSVVAGNIKALEIKSTHLAADSVIAGKVAALAIGARELKAESVVAGKVAANAIQAGNIAANGVQAGNVAADAILAGNLAANAVQAGDIAANAIIAGNIKADAFEGGSFTGGTFTGSVMRTAATGARVVMNGPSNRLQVYNAAGDNVVNLGTLTSGASTGLEVKLGPDMVPIDVSAFGGNMNTSSQELTFTTYESTVPTIRDRPWSSWWEFSNDGLATPFRNSGTRISVNYSTRSHNQTVPGAGWPGYIVDARTSFRIYQKTGASWPSGKGSLVFDGATQVLAYADTTAEYGTFNGQPLETYTFYTSDFFCLSLPPGDYWFVPVFSYLPGPRVPEWGDRIATALIRMRTVQIQQG